jgi:hypothetical protein
MATERTYSYYETSRQWSRELLAMFIVGFVAQRCCGLVCGTSRRVRRMPTRFRAGE